MKTKSTLLLIGTLLFLPPLARATTRTWTGGGTDNNWTTAANWGGVAPLAGDDLVFPAVNLRLSNTNNFAANTAFNSITFSGTNYVINGNAITNSAGITNSSSVATTNIFNCAIVLGANQTFNCASNTALNLGGAIDTFGKLLTFTGGGDFVASGVISSGGVLIKTGTGNLTLSGANTFSGSASFGAGSVTLQNSSALGNTGADTLISAGATLIVQSNITVAEASIFLNGTLRNGGGSNTFTGAISLGLATSTVDAVLGTTLVLGGALTGPGGLVKVGSGTLTLTGNTNNSFAGTTTVNEGFLQLNKPAGTNAIPADLVIGDGSGGINADQVIWQANDQVADSSTVTVNSSGLFKLDGHDETIGSLTMDGCAINATGILTLNGDLTVAGSALNSLSTLGGKLSLGGATRTCSVNNTNSGAGLVISATVSDGSASAGLIKAGSGQCTFSGSNTFSGPIIVATGTLTASHNNALGAAGGGTVVSNGAALRLLGGITLAESAVTLNGRLFNGDATNALTGTLTLGATNSAVDVSSGTQLTLSGAIDGSGGLLKLGSGVLQLSGTASNTFSGGTILGSTAGTLALNKTSPATAIPGPLTNSSTVRLLSSAQIDNGAAVTLNSGGLLDLNGQSETIGSLAGSASGSVTLGGATLTAGANDSSTTFAGIISGSGTFAKTGSGVMTLTGNNTQPTTSVIAGTLLINGSQPTNTVNVISGTLGGTGTVGSVTASSGGIVNPGASPGILNSSNANFTVSGHFAVELNGTTAGSGYDQLNVAGTVTLGSNPLDISVGFTPSVGNTFTIIANDGADAVSGTFGGLPEGTNFVVSGTRFSISYTGGSGNDVVLTVLPLPTGVTRIWTGATADNFWTTAANWSNTVAPAAGDDLLFPSGAARLSNSNNFAAGTVFNSILISGQNYTLAGNSITLNAGLTNSTAFGNQTVSLPIVLNSSQAFNCNGFMTLAGQVDLAGKNLTLDSPGVLTVSGSIVGSGNVQQTGAGIVTFSGANTYTGTSTVSAGTLEIANNAALGASSGNTVVAVGASLELESGITISEPITLSGTLGNLSGNNIATGNIALVGAPTVRVDPSLSLTLNGAISGAGSLTKTGAGSLSLGGTNANTYAGTTTVSAGTLRLAKTAGTNAVPGALVVGNATNALFSEFLILDASDQIADSAAITINHSGVLGVNAFNEAIGPLTMDDGTLQTSSGTVTLNGDVTRVAGTTAFPAIISGKLSLGGVTRTFNLNTNAGANAMSISANISDGSASAGITKTGAGLLNLTASNSYSGPTVIATGTLATTSGSGLGATGGGTVVSNGATLRVSSNISVGESALTVAGSVENLSGTNSLAGAITLSASNVTVFGGSGQLTFSGALTGAGGLVKTGNTLLQFSGAATNAFAGGMTVSQGTLLLSKSSGASAIPGPLTIAGTVRLQNDDEIANTAAVTLTSTGVLDIAANSEALGSLAGPGGAQVTLGGFGSLAVGGDNTSTSFAGLITGTDATLAKNGAGTLTLSGNNTYTGTTTVNAGTLIVNGSQSGSDVIVANGATLGGTGSVGFLTAVAGAKVSPGASPGILSSAGPSFSSGSFFTVELNGTTVGSGYDQLSVTGSVFLGSATLQVSLGFTPAISNSFTIIQNDGADAVAGTFAGLTNGATFTTNGARFSISYTGGTGNDVVLTVFPAASSPPSTITSSTVLSNGQFQLQGLGQSNLTYTIQANTNLSTTNWLVIGSAPANGSGVFSFTDTNAPSFPIRFYRAVSP